MGEVLSEVLHTTSERYVVIFPATHFIGTPIMPLQLKEMNVLIHDILERIGEGVTIFKMKEGSTKDVLVTSNMSPEVRVEVCDPQFTFS